MYMWGVGTWVQWGLGESRWVGRGMGGNWLARGQPKAWNETLLEGGRCSPERSEGQQLVLYTELEYNIYFYNFPKLNL